MNAYVKMNGGKAPEFMRAGGVIKTGFKQSVRASEKQFAAIQAAVEKSIALDKKFSKKTRSKKRRSKRLPSCLTASKKLHRATYHRDKGKKRSFYYTVKNGDSLGKIRKVTGKSTSSIKRYNRIRRNLIRPGQKLKVAECRL